MKSRTSLSSILKTGILFSVVLTSCSTMVVRDDWTPVTTVPEAVKSVPSPDSGGDYSSAAGSIEEATAQVVGGTMEMTVEEAVLSALEHNRALRVERLNPEIARTFVEQESAIFDPVLSAGISGDRKKSESRTGSNLRNSGTGGEVSVSRLLPTGTEVEAGISTDRSWGTSASDQHASRVGVSVTQALLRGRDPAANLADLRQAKLDSLLSEYEFRGYVEALTAQVETTYWDCVLALRQVEIVRESLSLAEQQIEETRQRIRIGVLAETELAAAEAEVALRRESLINAESDRESLQARLLRLIRPEALATPGVVLIPQSKPVAPELPLEALEDHAALALKLRPDLNQASVLMEKGDLEIAKTKNGLLPKMDLFVSLGKTGYSDSFGDSFGDIGNDGYDVSFELIFSRPFYNRDAEARNRRALLTRRQLDESLENMKDLARLDVELAYIEVNRAYRQVEATETTRKFQEEKLRAETVKFRVGKSTAILVAQAQRDLLAGRVGEVEAVTNYLKARVNLYLMEGSLLKRRGLSIPDESVEQRRSE